MGPLLAVNLQLLSLVHFTNYVLLFPIISTFGSNNTPVSATILMSLVNFRRITHTLAKITFSLVGLVLLPKQAKGSILDFLPLDSNGTGWW
jgi:hypothetical protein